MKTNSGPLLACAHTYRRDFASGSSGRNAFKTGSPVPASDSVHRKDAGVNPEGDRSGGSGGSKGDVRQTANSSPHWMRRLEERWQKLHRQINAPSPVHTSCDTWAVRRLLARRRETRLLRPTSSLTTYPTAAAVRSTEDLKVSVSPAPERCCVGTQAVGFLRATDRVGAATARQCQGHAGGERQNAPPSSAESRHPTKCGLLSLGATERDDEFGGSNGRRSVLTGDATLAQHAADTDPIETRAFCLAGSGEDSNRDNGGDTSPVVVTVVAETADDAWSEDYGDVKGETSSHDEPRPNSGEEREMNGYEDDGVDRSLAAAPDPWMRGNVRPVHGPAALRPRPVKSKSPHRTLTSGAVGLGDRAEAVESSLTQPERKGEQDGEGLSKRTSRLMKTTEQQNGARLFAQMSVEARHAVSETLQAMRSTDKGQVNTPGGIHNSNGNHEDDTLQAAKEDAYSSCNGQECGRDSEEKAQFASFASSKDRGSTREQTVPLGTNQRARAQKEGDRTRPVTGGKSSRNVPFQKPPIRVNNNLAHPKADKVDVAGSREVKADKEEEDKDKDDVEHLSLASTESMSAEGLPPPLTFDRTRLPAITSRTEQPTHGHARARGSNRRQLNYRLRGVGFYRVPREKTFEITAPDFDIRYREVITCQKGDRDTPPPDIFEKSVSKVKDWLTKYHTPR